MAKDAARWLCATDSGMSLGSWKAPATKMPGREDVTGVRRSVRQKPNWFSSSPRRWASSFTPALGPQAGRQDNQVELGLLLFAIVVEIANPQVMRVRHLDQARRDGADELHLLLVVAPGSRTDRTLCQRRARPCRTRTHPGRAHARWPPWLPWQRPCSRSTSSNHCRARCRASPRTE